MEFLETLGMFADDLYTFVLCECYGLGKHNIPEHGYQGSPFHGPLRMTVRHLLRVTEVASLNLLNDLIGQQGRMTSYRFRLFVAELIVAVSKRRYDPFEFVLFATLLSKLAVMCHLRSCGDCSGPVAHAVVEVGQRFRKKGQLNLPALLRLNKEICVADVMLQLNVLTL